MIEISKYCEETINLANLRQKPLSKRYYAYINFNLNMKSNRKKSFLSLNENMLRPYFKTYLIVDGNF